MNFKNLDGQLCRWSQILGADNYTIIFEQSRVHGNADGQSRRPCGACKYCEKMEEKQSKEVTSKAICQLNTIQSSNWFNGNTSLENRNLQMKDTNLQKMIKWKEENVRPTWPEISMFDAELKSLWTQWDHLILVE